MSSTTRRLVWTRTDLATHAVFVILALNSQLAFPLSYQLLCCTVQLQTKILYIVPGFAKEPISHLGSDGVQTGLVYLIVQSALRVEQNALCSKAGLDDIESLLNGIEVR
jgi:hypothetical protein